MEVAFGLRAAAKGSFAGGSFALPDGKTFDIGKRLKAGKGRIVTDDPFAIDQLHKVEVLKEVPVKRPAPKPKAKAGGAKSAPTKTSTNGGES